MLSRLTISNLALIDKAELSFEKGLTVLTGETGAGKSVIVAALSLALGGRADKDTIRYGKDSGTVEAVFDVSSMPADYLHTYSKYINGKKLTIFRQIKIGGKSRISVSGISVSAGELQEMTGPIAEILGQHANQLLMQEDNHIKFLDNFAGLQEVCISVRDSFLNWKTEADKLNKFISKREILQKEHALLQFQREEISRAAVTVGETEQLMQEKKILDSSRALMASANLICDMIDSDEASAVTLLSLMQKEIDKMASIDSSLDKKSEELVDISYRIKDFKDFIEQYGSAIVDDPARIEEINLRLDELYNLKKKYGGSEEAILQTLELIEQNLSESPANIDSYIEELELHTKKLFDAYAKQALALSDTRKKAAGYLQKLIKKELAELAIDNGGFEIEFVYEDDINGVLIEGRAVKPTANGLETARILFSANQGEPLKSLVKTASGGEISRVLLALKSAEKKNNQLSHSLLVFDEVDAGIGGQTAIEVAKKLKKLSDKSQLLVITHLHQIAREADHHFVVQKSNNNDEKRAVIKVKRLDRSGVQEELKRMVALPE